MVIAYRAVTIETLREDVKSGKQTLETFHDDVVEYRRQSAALLEIPHHV